MKYIHHGNLSIYIHFQKHPTHVYESEHMSSVTPPVVNVHLKLKPSSPDVQDTISDVQMEAIAYAINTMYDPVSIENHTRGFFLGDGTGVGKSRTISGILSELWMNDSRNYKSGLD